MKKTTILSLAILFLLAPQELFGWSPWPKPKPSILVILQVWPEGQFHANIEVNQLTGRKSKTHSYWVSTNESICEIKINTARYTVYTARTGKKRYLVQFYQSPESGGPITGSLVVPIVEPHEIDISSDTSSSLREYRVHITSSSNKKYMDALSGFYTKDGLFSCEVKPSY